MLTHILIYYLMTVLYTYVLTFGSDRGGQQLRWCVAGLAGTCDVPVSVIVCASTCHIHVCVDDGMFDTVLFVDSNPAPTPNPTTTPAMAFVELRLVIDGAALPLPFWLFPRTTAGDVVYALHRLYPAYLHGVKAVLGVFYVDVEQRR